MNKFFLIVYFVVCAQLTACGGGGGGGGGTVSSSNSSNTYVFQTSVFSPVAGQSQMNNPSAATLANPRFMAYDGTYLYIAGGTDNNVVRIDANGIQTTLTGFLGGPAGVAVQSGNLYVTQSSYVDANSVTHNGGVYTVSLSGLVNGTLTAVGPSILPNTSNVACTNCLGLTLVSGVAYAGVSGSNSVHSYNLTNQSWIPPITVTPLTSVTGITTDSTYWVTTDYSNSMLRVYDSNWTEQISQRHTISGGQPYGVAVASNGDVYVASYQGNSVIRFHQNVEDSTPFLDSTKVCHPTGLVVDNQAKFLYVVSGPSSAGCGISGQTTGYVLKASINLAP